MPEKDSLNDPLHLKIQALEARITRLESRLSNGIPVYPGSESESDTFVPVIRSGQDNEDKEFVFESMVGGNGLALIGNIVLMFGIVFLWQYIQKSGYPGLSFLAGYIMVGLVFSAAHLLKNKIASLSFMFEWVAWLLLFYMTLSLHFFSEHPVISEKSFVLMFLLVVIGVQVYFTVKKKSPLYASIGLIMTFVTGVISDTNFFMLSTSTLVAFGSVYYFYRYGWRSPLVIAIFLAYSVFIIWMLKNPELLDVVNFKIHHVCNLYLISCALAFSLANLVPTKEGGSRNFIMGSVLLNGMNFSIVLMFFAFTFFSNNYVILFVTISIFCILFSIILQNFSPWKFSPAFYAMYGFVAVSVSVYGLVGLPNAFLFLTLQSLLVLSMALWFRSLIIVVLNAAMLVCLLLIYLFSSESRDIINFSFAFVAFITARVINIKKERLNLETNYLRNMYLGLMFMMVLYSLHQALPKTYVTLSWTISALVFFIFNLILGNAKYRLMAILAIISAAFRLFIVDLSSISFALRAVAFLLLAIISIGISIYYFSKKKPESGDEFGDGKNETG